MTTYDAVMAVVVIAGMVWGAWRGITWQLASIASLILGYSVAHPLSAQLAPQFPGDPVVSRALAMLAVYAIVSAGVFAVAWIVRTTLRRLQFEAFDRHLGMVLGGIEGAILGLVATLFVVSLAPQSRNPIFTSPTGRVVGQVMDTLGPVLPSEARNVLTPFWPSSSNALVAGAPNGPSESIPEARGEVREPDRPSLQNILEAGESRIGRAIAETVDKNVERTGGTNGREVERR